MSIFSERLVALRCKSNYSHSEIASYLNITRGAYTHYERGRREPDFNTLCRLASFFSVTPSYLLGFEEKYQQNQVNSETQIDSSPNTFSCSSEEEELVKQIRQLPNSYKTIINSIIQLFFAGKTYLPDTPMPQLHVQESHTAFVKTKNNETP